MNESRWRAAAVLMLSASLMSSSAQVTSSAAITTLPCLNDCMMMNGGDKAGCLSAYDGPMLLLNECFKKEIMLDPALRSALFECPPQYKIASSCTNGVWFTQPAISGTLVSLIAAEVSDGTGELAEAAQASAATNAPTDSLALRSKLNDVWPTGVPKSRTHDGGMFEDPGRQARNAHQGEFYLVTTITNLPPATPTTKFLSKLFRRSTHLPKFNQSVSSCLDKFYAPLTVTQTVAAFDSKDRPTAVLYNENVLPTPHWGVTNDTMQFYGHPVDAANNSRSCLTQEACMRECVNEVHRASFHKLMSWSLPLAAAGLLALGIASIGLCALCLRRHRKRPRHVKVKLLPTETDGVVEPVTVVEPVSTIDGAPSIHDPEHDGVTMKRTRAPKMANAFSVFSRRRDDETEAQGYRIDKPAEGVHRAVSSGTSATPDGVIVVERNPHVRDGEVNARH